MKDVFCYSASVERATETDMQRCVRDLVVAIDGRRRSRQEQGQRRKRAKAKTRYNGECELIQAGALEDHGSDIACAKDNGRLMVHLFSSAKTSKASQLRQLSARPSS